jgi:hypothetical protein
MTMATEPTAITSDDPEGTRDHGLFVVTAWEISSPEFHGIVCTHAIALDKLAALPSCEIRAVALWQTHRPDHPAIYHEATAADYECAAERSLTKDRWRSYTHTRGHE